MAEAPHSAGQFVASRDLWWHADYLDLLAARIQLDKCRSVLELGAGVGHWTEHVIARVASDAAYTATDREPEWVAALTKRFASRPRFSAVKADAANLERLGGSFDLVTCQTLLLHVPDVAKVLAAVRRCMAPNGLLLLVEPNNFMNRLPTATSADSLSPAEFGALSALWWAYERGRVRLGLGRETIAEHLPRLIAETGFIGLEVYANDRMLPEFPPYDTADQLAMAAAPPGGHEGAAAGESEQDLTRRLALAGGLDEATFDAAWALELKLRAERDADIVARRFAFSGASHCYIFTARKG